MDFCEAKLGGLDILVPNAGISAGAAPQDMSEADFNAVMDVNFMSVFALCQVAHPLLKKGGRGKVLTVGSEYSIYGSANTIGYSSSKHAILGLTKSLAVSWARDHIQVRLQSSAMQLVHQNNSTHRECSSVNTLIVGLVSFLSQGELRDPGLDLRKCTLHNRKPPLCLVPACF